MGAASMPLVDDPARCLASASWAKCVDRVCDEANVRFAFLTWEDLYPFKIASDSPELDTPGFRNKFISTYSTHRDLDDVQAVSTACHSRRGTTCRCRHARVRPTNSFSPTGTTRWSIAFFFRHASAPAASRSRPASIGIRSGATASLTGIATMR